MFQKKIKHPEMTTLFSEQKELERIYNKLKPEFPDMTAEVLLDCLTLIGIFVYTQNKEALKITLEKVIEVHKIHKPIETNVWKRGDS